ncbi:hypothetical protein SAMN05428945_2351 [Streptomyces sp. 2224.1]|nr:hypothetical protein BX261_2977 [Streptomyces sp. 2321.6]SDR45351.1 hypothetical protein SAMN05216511_4223 [Streptomyces sp. KS_16]SEC22453.1 hypothetical protein SAMN05428945_2351 [Streptomyces sp. 2224.1]SEC82148.1 hypothetical protein SAMN05428940_2981 [Streptomyces sp. 2133.1]SEE87124.1 hypothetical protein SAMN05428954_4260 [Streptomyces sp. 2112.3]SNC69130.1 hypothetical protein SAMN06272741_2974 [Streptomyces sp. 2114.4]
MHKASSGDQEVYAPVHKEARKVRFRAPSGR